MSCFCVVVSDLNTTIFILYSEKWLLIDLQLLTIVHTVLLLY